MQNYDFFHFLQNIGLKIFIIHLSLNNFIVLDSHYKHLKHRNQIFSWRLPICRYSVGDKAVYFLKYLQKHAGEENPSSDEISFIEIDESAR